jgi:hypothetical protein
MHRLAAALVVCPAVVLSAACVTHVADAPDEVGSAAEPGLHHGYGAGPVEPPGLDEPSSDNTIPPGPCKTACRQVMSEGCNNWEADCVNASPDDEYVTCGDQYLTCAAAQHALQGTLFGQMWCYRSCMNLH